MASNIDCISIDETFPIAGRDNDSQGFRDNFSIIKNNFESAKGEIEDLQFNTARIDQATNFNGENITNANFVACSEELFQGGPVGNTISPTIINWQEGSYHTFQVTNDIQFDFSGFPGSGKVGKLRVEIQGDPNNISRSINFIGSFKKSPNVPTLPLTITSSTHYHIFEFWTYNGGTTVFADYLGRFE